MSKEFKFKTGDVVLLKSGSPDMTVTEQSEGDTYNFYTCRYWNEQKKEFVLIKYLNENELVASADAHAQGGWWATA